MDAKILSPQEEANVFLNFLEINRAKLRQTETKKLGKAVKTFADSFFKALSMISKENKTIVIKKIIANQKFREKEFTLNERTN